MQLSSVRKAHPPHCPFDRWSQAWGGEFSPQKCCVLRSSIWGECWWILLIHPMMQWHFFKHWQTWNVIQNIELKLLSSLDLLWSACYCDICERGELLKLQHDDQWRRIKSQPNDLCHEFLLDPWCCHLEALNEQHWTGRHGNSEIVGSLVFFFRAVSRKTVSWCSVEELFPWDTVCIEDRTGLNWLTLHILTPFFWLYMEASCICFARSNLEVPSQDIAIRFPRNGLALSKLQHFHPYTT